MVRGWIGLLVGTFLIPAVLFPAALSGQSEAFSIPVSNRVIVGDLTLPNGDLARFKVYDGAMVTLRTEGSERLWGFSPSLGTDTADEVVFHVYEIFEYPDGNQAISEYGSLLPGATKTVEGDDLPFTARVAGIEEGSYSEDSLRTLAAAALDGQDVTEELGRCCVTCNGQTVCACKVKLSCGSCCSPGCCDGGGGCAQNGPGVFYPTPPC